MSRRQGRGEAAGNNGDRSVPAGAVSTIDVAHPPMSSGEAEAALDDLLRSSSGQGKVRIIRVIHGYGSGGKGGTLRIAVRNWAYRRRGKLLLIIPGEEFSPFDHRLGEVLGETGVPISTLGPSDPGVTLIILR